MGLDDMMSTESAFVATATAAVFSPKVRGTLRKGAVYGVAGALKAGDVVVGAARGVARGVRGDETAAADPAANGAGGTSSPATPELISARGSSGTRSRRAAGTGSSGSSARRAGTSGKPAGSRSSS